MTTKTQLLSAFFLFFSLSLFSQHQFGVQLGLGGYSTPDSYINDEISENGMIHGRGSRNMPEFINDPALQLTYQYRLSNRFRLAAQSAIFKTKTIADKNAYISRSTNSNPSTTTDLSSPRTLWAARIDGLVYLNLLPNKKTALLLGTGSSFVHRSQNYRSYYQVDFDDLNQGTIINEIYIDETSDSFGIPVALHLGIPLSDKWHITGTVSSAFYRNSDVFFLATAGLA